MFTLNYLWELIVFFAICQLPLGKQTTQDLFTNYNPPPKTDKQWDAFHQAITFCAFIL